MTEYIFIFFASCMLLSALLVVAGRNAVHSVLFLIFCFINAAALLILIGAEYIAMTLIIVYVGAVAVLFLFVVMMLDVEDASIKKLALTALPISILLSSLLFFEINWAMRQSTEYLKEMHSVYEHLQNTEAIGMQLYTKYILPFQSAGLILLVAIIGSILLTMDRNKNVKRQDVFKQLARTREDSVELVEVKFSKGVKLP